MSTNLRLTKDDSGSCDNQSLCKSMIGSLLYLNKVDLCWCLCYVLKESHLFAVKRIICFVNETINDDIWYMKGTNLSLARYSDVDQTNNGGDKNNTTGDCFYLDNNLVSWQSKKQNSISLSFVEAEQIAAGSCCTQLLWLKKILEDYSIVEDILTEYCDITIAINISKNLVQYFRIKFIDIRHHFICDLVDSKIVSLECSKIKNQLVDIFTKLFGCIYI